MKTSWFYLAFPSLVFAADPTVTKTPSPAFAVANVNSVSAATTSILTLNGGNSGGKLELGAGATGAITLTATSGQNINLVTSGGGSVTGIPAGGDVSGPASSTNNAIPVFSGTGGKTLTNSGGTTLLPASNAILLVGASTADIHLSDSSLFKSNAQEAVLSVQCTDATRYSALAFIDSSGDGHSAIGYGNPSASSPWGASTFIESYRPNYLGNGNAPRMRFLLTDGAGVSTTILELAADKSSSNFFNFITGTRNINGGGGLTITNSNTGSSASADMVSTSGSGNIAAISAYSASYSFHGYPASGGAFVSSGSGGVAVMATHASGVIQFFSGGDTSSELRATITATGFWQIGGTTSASPGFKKSSATLAFRLADDSADAPISAAEGTFSGDVATSVVGKTFSIKSGSNAKSGTFTLSSGAVTVSNTSITANSVVCTSVKTSRTSTRK